MTVCEVLPEYFTEDTSYLFEPGHLRTPPIEERYLNVAVAVEACSMCPLLYTCRDAGLEETSGIWGGRVAGS